MLAPSGPLKPLWGGPGALVEHLRSCLAINLASLEPLGPIITHRAPSGTHLGAILTPSWPSSEALECIKPLVFHWFFNVFEMPPLGYMFYDRGLFWAILASSWPLLKPSWGILGASLGPSWRHWGLVGPPWGGPGAPRGHLRDILSYLKLVLDQPGPSCGHLGADTASLVAFLWRSYGVLGASLGPLLGILKPS